MFFVFGSQTFFTALYEIIYFRSDVNYYLQAFIGLLLFFAAFSGYIWATLSTIYLVAGEFSGEKITWQQALRIGYGKKLLNAIGQSFIVMLVIAAVVGVAAIAIVPALHDSIGIIAALWILFIVIAGILFILFLELRWFFSVTMIAWENANVFGSLKRSAEIVSGHMWRLFWIILLFEIISSVITSLTDGVLNVFGLPDVPINITEALRYKHIEGVIVLLSQINKWVAIPMTVSGILSTIFSSIYVTLLYFDLRARDGEFEEDTTGMLKSIQPDE